MNHRRWNLDAAALAVAKQELGLVKPVHVQVKDSQKLGHGRSEVRGQTARLQNGEHLVLVRDDLSPEGATFILWHELAHCRQVERHRFYRWRYRLANKLVGYRNNPFEREANKIAFANSGRALVKQVAA